MFTLSFSSSLAFSGVVFGDACRGDLGRGRGILKFDEVHFKFYLVKICMHSGGNF
jgi:hypothetical protein